MNRNHFKLEIELIPESTMHLNLRNRLTSYQWRQFSQNIQKRDQYTCCICNRVKGDTIDKLHCHELWTFDTEAQVQYLTGFQSLCFQCHMIKHIGFATMNDWVEKYQLIEHFCTVNQVSRKQYAQHLHDAVQLWIARNQINWHVDLGDYIS